MSHIPKNVLTVRELAGLSQAKFGDLFHATKDMVHSYESEKANPSDAAIEVIAGLIGVTTETFRTKRLKKEDFSPSDVKKRMLDIYKGRRDELARVLNTPSDDPRDKLIASLERENARLQKDLDLSLGEVRHNILLSRATAEVTQNLVIEFLAKQRKMTWEELAVEVGKLNGERYQSIKEEGSFAYVGK